MPTIAIVIPVASDQHRLSGLLKSLQAQDRLPDEVIIVSAHALSDYAAEFSLPISALKNPSGAI
ncbi:MAG: glycosyltransferase, partial [Chloroflexota bacterium]